MKAERDFILRDFILRDFILRDFILRDFILRDFILRGNYFCEKYRYTISYYLAVRVSSPLVFAWLLNWAC